MKRQEWKKWMAGVLAAGMLLAQPAAAFADPAADASASSSSSTSSSSESDTGETPEDPGTGGEDGGSDGKEDGGSTENPSDQGGSAGDVTPTPAPVDPSAEDPSADVTPTPSASPTPAADSGSQEDPGQDSIEIVEETDPEQKEEEEKTEEEKQETSTNEQLVSGQQIVHAPVIIENFRFWTVPRKYAFAKESDTAILEEMKEDARSIGTLPENGLCYVLKDDAQEGPEIEEQDPGQTGTGSSAETSSDSDSTDVTIEVTGKTLDAESSGETTWLYVESNGVRGFVKDEDLYSGRRAQEILETYLEMERDPETHELTAVLSDDVPMAEALVEPEENAAYGWINATVEQTMISKDYAFSNDRISVREEKSKDARAIGVMPKGALCYIVADRDEEWVYVESGDVRGFVRNEYLEKDEKAYLQEEPDNTFGSILAEELVSAGTDPADQISDTETSGDDGMVIEVQTDDDLPASDAALRDSGNPSDSRKAGRSAAAESQSAANVEDQNVTETDTEMAHADTEAAGSGAEAEAEEDPLAEIDQEKYPVYYKVMEQKEDSFRTAEQNIEPEENKALYYTLTSPKPGTPGGKVRDSLISYASEFVGNPYVWGGTSLTGGADCSGFVQSIYAQYDIALPRTSGEQSQFGTKIPVEEAEPGDLIFYAENGVVYHVVIYAGEGRTIEAMNESRGITYGNVLTSDAVWATRILNDTYDEVVDFSADIAAQNATKEMYGKELGEFRITYYCPCDECNGSYGAQSATGAPLVQGRTIAVDPTIIPYGTHVIIGGHVFTAEDCGGAIKGKRIDIFVNEHAMTEALGTTSAHVYLTN